jgi:hypothetical protein
LFDEQSVEGIVAAVHAFESVQFVPDAIVGHVRKFSIGRFAEEMGAQVDSVLATADRLGFVGE